jgi:hypothetical protein
MNARSLALVLLLLEGCATLGVDLTAAKDSWQGERYETVVARWGAPARSTVLADGRDSHTWSSIAGAGGSWFPTIGVSSGSGMGMGAGVTSGQNGMEPVRCERTLIFSEGRVVEQSWLGQWRYCSSFRRN